MSKSFVLVLGVVALLASPTIAQDQGSAKVQKKAELKVGDEAPDWELTGSDGKVYKLSNYKGKQAVVVAWYPMALTGG